MDNYTVGTKGLCSTDLFNEVSLIFIHMVCTGKFLLQMLQMKFASIYSFGVLVDFKFSMDFPENWVNMQLLIGFQH